MKKITLLPVCLILFVALAQAQKKPAQKKDQPSMEEMMKQLQKEMEADPEKKKAMEENGVMDMLKQVEKTTKAAGVKNVDINAMAVADINKIPAKPSSLPIHPTPVSKEQLKTYLQPFMQSTDAAIKPEHRSAITAHLNKGKETGVIAMAYLTQRELDKALYLLLNACIANPDDYASLNNLGAFMTMSGYAHKSLPLLHYVQKQFPQSATLLNNLGQAWLSLGYLDKAEKFLKDALKADKKQTQASYSLAVMAKHQGNKAKCVEYVKQTIENGGSTPDALGMLASEAQGTDFAKLLRPRYERYYKKDHAIIKRFRLPPVPASYGEALNSYEEVETFFQNLDETTNEALVRGEELSLALQQQRQQIQKSQNNELTAMMKNPGDPGALQRHYIKYNHPLQTQAHFMLSSISNPAFSTSYAARMQREEENMANGEKKLIKSLEGLQQQRSALLQAASKLEGGEGRGEEEEQIQRLLDQACEIQRDYESQFLSGKATLANQYLHNMEDLLNQKLQEEIFWLLIVGYPADPTASVFTAYTSYLSGINRLKNIYPNVFELTPPCGEKGPGYIDIVRKLQQWEADHCQVSWGFDVGAFKGNFNCNGMKMQMNFGVASIEYGQTQDPATWETSSHTISTEVGAKKEFEVGKTLTGEVGGSVKTTVTIDKGGHISEVTVGGSVGAGISGPIGSAGVELGSAEITLSGGFNSSGPSVNPISSSFLRGN